MFQLIKRTKYDKLCHHYINYANVQNVMLFCYFLSLRSKYPIRTLFSQNDYV